MNRTWLAWLVILMAFLVAGCSVDQAREVQSYRKILDAGQTRPLAPFSPGEPLSLKRALALANANNEQLASTGEDYLQALIDKDRAFARFLPTIGFTPSYMRQEKSSIDAGNPLIASIVRQETLDAPLQANADINPLQDASAIWAATTSAQQWRALLLDRQSILLLDVAQTYYQVMRSEKQVQVLKHSVKVQQQRVKDMIVQSRAGVVRPMDVAQSEAQLAATRGTLIQAQNDGRHGRAMLAQLMGVSAVRGPLVGGFSVPPGNPPLSRLLTLADAHRQDLQAARMQVKAAAQRLKIAWEAYFPSVSLNLTRYLYRESFPDDVDWTGLIQINLPIFSAGLIHANIRTAYSKLRQAHLAESGLRRTVLKQLRVATEDLAADRQQIHQLGIRVAAAREAMRQADAAYKAGLGTHLDLLVSQNQLLSAQLASTEEQFRHKVDYLRLMRTLGLLNVRLTPLPSDGSGKPASLGPRPISKADAPKTP